jgi:aminoglycoside phosphotransferase (APT) family kinase protein
VSARLRELPEVGRTALIHGDLIPANVLVAGGRVSGVLDFGFFTTVGDPQFDAAITASVFDMYGPNARRSEDVLSAGFAGRFGHDPARFGLYRAAYAIVTNAYFGRDGTDGHFLWCARMLRRRDVRAAVTT